MFGRVTPLGRVVSGRAKNNPETACPNKTVKDGGGGVGVEIVVFPSIDVGERSGGVSEATVPLRSTPSPTDPAQESALGSESDQSFLIAFLRVGSREVRTAATRAHTRMIIIIIIFRRYSDTLPTLGAAS